MEPCFVGIGTQGYQNGPGGTSLLAGFRFQFVTQL